MRIAHGLGFLGAIEYRHVATDSGGAQYCLGPTAEEDLLLVFPEAFERDANPEDFSLEAILAHERGHQLVHWHEGLRRSMIPFASSGTEEILHRCLVCWLWSTSGIANCSGSRRSMTRSCIPTRTRITFRGVFKEWLRFWRNSYDGFEDTPCHARRAG